MNHPTATMAPSRSSRPLLLATLLGLGLSATPTPGQAIEALPGPLRLTPAQQQKLLPEWRRISLQTNAARMAILQKQRQCLTAAGSLEALQDCQRQQREALISQQRQRQEAMRQMLRRIGITAPAARQGEELRPRVPQPDSVPMI